MKALPTIVLKTLCGLVLCVALFGCERWTLDKQMEELCAKDGGIVVFEKVTLPATYFYQDGALKRRQTMLLGPDPSVNFERIGDDDFRIITTKQYLVGSQSTNLQRGNGVLIRMQVRIVRWKDKQLLGEQVWFDRGGGDGFTFGFQPSGKTCPLLITSLTQSVFVKGE